MTTPTDNNRELLTIIAFMRAKPGKEQELREALEGLIAPTMAEEGSVNYDLHQGVDDPALFYFYENYTSPEAFDAHMNSAHLKEFAGRLDELLDGELNIQQLRRVA